MSMQHETTAEEIAALLNDDGGIDARMVQGNPMGYPHAKIPRELCEEWRERAAAGESPRDLAEEHGDIKHSGVHYHLNDDCQHVGVADE